MAGIGGASPRVSSCVEPSVIGQLGPVGCTAKGGNTRIAQYLSLLSAVVVAAFFVLSAGASASPPVQPYGEIARFGGFATGASYSTSGEYQTTNLGDVGKPATFVYPIGMAVDGEDPTAPDKYAIYILENINLQALDEPGAESSSSTSAKLEYRIQKVSDDGTALASTTFKLDSTESTPGLHAIGLAVDGPADRVYVLIDDVPPVADNGGEKGAVYSIDAWTTGRSGSALAPAVHLTSGVDDDLPEDPTTSLPEDPTTPHPGMLAGPGTLQGSGPSALLDDVDGAALNTFQRYNSPPSRLADRKGSAMAAKSSSEKPGINKKTMSSLMWRTLQADLTGP